MENSKPMIDGKQLLLNFVRAYHPRHEHDIADLERLLRRIGFELTSADEEKVTILGPRQTTTVCRTMVLFGGRMKVRHFALIQALERLLEVGLPSWKTESEQFAWHLNQLEQCESFQIPAREQFETRQDLENHLEQCVTCQPASRLLTEAVILGSSRHADKHLRELVDRSHEDQQAAVKFYEAVRDSQRLPYSVPEKPSRSKKSEVTA